MDGSNKAIRECRWRNEFYESSKHFYVGQIHLKCVLDILLKISNRWLSSRRQDIWGLELREEIWVRNTDWEVIRDLVGKLHRTHTYGKINN